MEKNIFFKKKKTKTLTIIKQFFHSEKSYMWKPKPLTPFPIGDYFYKFSSLFPLFSSLTDVFWDGAMCVNT